MRRRRTGDRPLDVDAVVDRAAAVRVLGEASADRPGDVLAAADDHVGVTQASVDGALVDLGQPLALHVQGDPRVRVEAPNHRHRLREVVDVHDVHPTPPDVERDPEPVGERVHRGGEEGLVGRRSRQSARP